MTRPLVVPEVRTPAHEAWRLLHRLFPGIRAKLMSVWADFELTPAQGRVLQYLDPARPVPMAELATLHCCDASNITVLVDKLESRRLIERTTSREDRRVKTVALTEAGAELRERLLERVAEPPAFITALSPVEQRTLRDLLLKAIDGLENA